MTIQRRSLLTLSAAGAAGVDMSLLGTGPAGAAARAGAPTQRFAVGVRQYAWSRGSRRWTNYVYSPATGAPGGSPIANAPVAQGVFPVCEFMHGFSSSPQNSLAVIRPLAEAGFVVPAPTSPTSVAKTSTTATSPRTSPRSSPGPSPSTRPATRWPATSTQRSVSASPATRWAA